MKRSLASIASSTSTSKKRRHSDAASPEPDADDSLSPLDGTPAEPSKHARNRQRTDSFAVRARKDSERFASRIQVAMKTKDEEEAVETNTIRMKSSAGAASALRKLKEKLNSTHGQLDLVATHHRRSRSPSPVDTAELFAFPSGDTPDHPATPPPPATTTKPLQTLSLNTEPITVSSSSFARRPLRVVPGARINKFGCYEPDISEFELSIASVTGSATPEFEVWDQDDELFFVGPLALHLTLKDPVKWAGLPLSHPDVVVAEMTCTSKPILSAAHPYRSVSSTTSDLSIFASRYEAPEPKSKPRSPSSATPIVPPDPKRGIVIEPLWMRTYPDTDPYTGKLVGRRGWATHFSVPVATRLFEKCETREFGFDVKILVWGDVLRVDGGATMCVSHLHRDRDMAGHTSNGAI
uniref:Uncharacterized protein n=1 Tax=Mycena chlorophos TaxID=658473 RepID=A0ABQ0M209_MYCCL|nr:predicted protein [Mycena chlorophos]